MTSKIYKYSFKTETSINIPIEAKPIFVGEQPAGSGKLHAWCEVPTTELPGELKTLNIIGTGHSIPENSVYVGSAICQNGLYVWHVYQIRLLSEIKPY